jgi:hypothetical protein
MNTTRTPKKNEIVRKLGKEVIRGVPGTSDSVVTVDVSEGKEGVAAASLEYWLSPTLLTAETT